MAGFYKYTPKTYTPGQKAPFKLSRSKIDLFFECPRCFYIDQRLGVKRPQFPAFTLNSAVDKLLKKEFDIHRADKTSHPLMKAYGVDAIPFSHKDMENWRHNFTGVQHIHPETNFLVYGAVDDIWENKKGELHVVDYKSTSKEKEIELEDTRWHNQYRRQMEVYQWLMRRNSFTVSNTGYFVYVNGKTDRAAFDGKLEFDVKIIPYEGNDGWVEKTIIAAKRCLEDDRIPAVKDDCEYCSYVTSLGNVLRNNIDKTSKKDGSKRTLFS